MLDEISRGERSWTSWAGLGRREAWKASIFRNVRSLIRRNRNPLPRWHSRCEMDIALMLGMSSEAEDAGDGGNLAAWMKSLVGRRRQAVSDYPRDGTGIFFLAGEAGCKGTRLACGGCRWSLGGRSCVFSFESRPVSDHIFVVRGRPSLLAEAGCERTLLCSPVIFASFVRQLLGGALFLLKDLKLYFIFLFPCAVVSWCC